MIRFREARRDDVPAIAALLRDDPLGATREGEDMAPYFEAFEALADTPMHRLVIGEDEGDVVACYQLSFLDGLSNRGARRAQIEGVRVAADRRGRGIGRLMMSDAERRARTGGAKIIQLTTHRSRSRAHAFYQRLGYSPSHLGFKRALD